MTFVIYVDNLFKYNVEIKKIKNIKEIFKDKPHTSDSGLILVYLKLAVTQNCSNKTFCFGQQKSQEISHQNHEI